MPIFLVEITKCNSTLSIGAYTLLLHMFVYCIIQIACLMIDFGRLDIPLIMLFNHMNILLIIMDICLLQDGFKDDSVHIINKIRCVNPQCQVFTSNIYSKCYLFGLGCIC